MCAVWTLAVLGALAWSLRLGGGGVVDVPRLRSWGRLVPWSVTVAWVCCVGSVGLRTSVKR